MAEPGGGVRIATRGACPRAGPGPSRGVPARRSPRRARPFARRRLDRRPARRRAARPPAAAREPPGAPARLPPALGRRAGGRAGDSRERMAARQLPPHRGGGARRAARPPRLVQPRAPPSHGARARGRRSRRGSCARAHPEKRRAPRRRAPRDFSRRVPDDDASHARRALGVAELPPRRSRRAPRLLADESSRFGRTVSGRTPRSRASRPADGGRTEAAPAAFASRLLQGRREFGAAAAEVVAECPGDWPRAAARSRTRFAPSTSVRPPCRSRSRTPCRRSASAARSTGARSSSA